MSQCRRLWRRGQGQACTRHTIKGDMPPAWRCLVASAWDPSVLCGQPSACVAFRASLVIPGSGGRASGPQVTPPDAGQREDPYLAVTQCRATRLPTAVPWEASVIWVLGDTAGSGVTCPEVSTDLWSGGVEVVGVSGPAAEPWPSHTAVSVPDGGVMWG